jgi:hypothetical protein
MGRKIAWVLSLAVLVVTGGLGIFNGLNEWGEGETTAQRLVPIGVFLYGVFGLITAYGLLRRRRWSVKTSIAWAVPVTYVPGLAVMAYGGEDAILGSAIAASAGSLLIALGVVWTANAITRDRTAAQHEGPSR